LQLKRKVVVNFTPSPIASTNSFHAIPLERQQDSGARGSINDIAMISRLIAAMPAWITAARSGQHRAVILTVQNFGGSRCGMSDLWP
jgi:hypothetical protein